MNIINCCWKISASNGKMKFLALKVKSFNCCMPYGLSFLSFERVGQHASHENNQNRDSIQHFQQNQSNVSPEDKTHKETAISHSGQGSQSNQVDISYAGDGNYKEVLHKSNTISLNFLKFLVIDNCKKPLYAGC